MKTPTLIDVPQNSAAEEIYAAYPRRVGKEAAIKSICRALKKHPFLELKRRTEEFARLFMESGKGLEFVPYPTTFYNQSRFLDDYDAIFPQQNQAKKSTAPNTFALVEARKAKQARMIELKAAHTYDDAFGTRWQSAKAWSEWKKLRDEVKALNEQIEGKA